MAAMSVSSVRLVPSSPCQCPPSPQQASFFRQSQRAFPCEAPTRIRTFESQWLARVRDRVVHFRWWEASSRFPFHLKRATVRCNEGGMDCVTLTCHTWLTTPAFLEEDLQSRFCDQDPTHGNVLCVLRCCSFLAPDKLFHYLHHHQSCYTMHLPSER